MLAGSDLRARIIDLASQECLLFARLPLALDELAHQFTHDLRSGTNSRLTWIEVPDRFDAWAGDSRVPPGNRARGPVTQAS